MNNSLAVSTVTTTSLWFQERSAPWEEGWVPIRRLLSCAPAGSLRLLHLCGPACPGGSCRSVSTASPRCVRAWLLWACPSMGSWFWVPFGCCECSSASVCLESLSSGEGARSEERGCWRDGLIFEELLTILHSSHTVLHLISNTGGSNFAISSLTTTLVIFRFGAPVVSSHAGGVRQCPAAVIVLVTGDALTIFRRRASTTPGALMGKLGSS